MFRGIATSRVGDGTTVLFWCIVWNDHLLQSKYPRLYSFAKNKQISVDQFILNNQVEVQLHLLLSVQAFQEYQELLECDKYTSSKFYHLPYRNLNPPQQFIWIWDSKCANKIRIFTWLLFMDRLNARNILRRKKIKLECDNYNFVLCSRNREETTFHLFFSCPFSKECWKHLNIN
jgi:hypothetical protein